jgi:hypothetical protein
MAVGLRTAIIVNEPTSHGATLSLLNEDSSAFNPISNASLIRTGLSSLLSVVVPLGAFFLIRERVGSGAGVGAAVYESFEETDKRRRLEARA